MSGEQSVNLINGLLRQGDLAMQAGNIDGAKTAYQRVKDTARGISSGRNSAFAIACDKLGDVARFTGQLSLAYKEYDEALPIFRHLASANVQQRGEGLKKVGDAYEGRRDLSLCLSKIGELYLAERNLPESRNALDEHYKLAKEIASADPGHCKHQSDLSGAHGRLQQLAMASGDLDEAVRHAEAAQAIIEKLVGIDSSNIGWVQDLAGSNCMYGSLLLRTGDMPRGVSMLTKGYGMLRQLDNQGKLNAKGKRLLAQLNEQLG
jgi:tetratricopeptide (TPR) repeat protein